MNKITIYSPNGNVIETIEGEEYYIVHYFGNLFEIRKHVEKSFYNMDGSISIKITNMPIIAEGTNSNYNVNFNDKEVGSLKLLDDNGNITKEWDTISDFCVSNNCQMFRYHKEWISVVGNVVVALNDRNLY